METQSNSLSAGRPQRVLYTRGEKAVHLANWQTSGLSAVEYARISGIHVRNLYRWSRKAQHGGELLAGSARVATKQRLCRTVDAVQGDAREHPVFLQMDLQKPVAARAVPEAQPAPGGGIREKVYGKQTAVPVCGALPPVTLRCGALEVEVGATATVSELVEVLSAIRREVLYV